MDQAISEQLTGTFVASLIILPLFIIVSSLILRICGAISKVRNWPFSNAVLISIFTLMISIVAYPASLILVDIFVPSGESFDGTKFLRYILGVYILAIVLTAIFESVLVRFIVSASWSKSAFIASSHCLVIGIPVFLFVVPMIGGLIGALGLTEISELLTGDLAPDR